MDKHRIPTRIPSFQKNSGPICPRRLSLAASRGKAPKKVPDGQRYLQKAGIFAKLPPKRNQDPIHTSRRRTAYFPYFRIWWKGSRFLLRNRGILYRRSCTSPNGQSQPQTKRPSRLPNTKRNPSTAKGISYP